MRAVLRSDDTGATAGTRLIDVTFCVLDLETTGGSPVDDEICEIGAVRVRGGRCLGTFHTHVDPGREVPAQVTELTGLTGAVVRPAPPVHAVLASLLDFIGDAVVVGHNVRFDRAFLDAALLRDDRPPLGNVFVDTHALARRLVADEVANHRLGTLADHFRLAHRPTHRALDDALATTDLLHALLERAAGFGVSALDDLVALPQAGAHPQAAKLTLTDRLPRGPGVFVIRDGGGRPLYVGKASNIRRRVRGYFSGHDTGDAAGDAGRRLRATLRAAASIDHVSTSTSLEAAVLEIRMIHDLLPRDNRHGTSWSKSAFVKLTSEAFPRLSVVKRVRDDGGTYHGPLPSSRVAKQVAEAVYAAVPIHRGTADAEADDTDVGDTAIADRARRAITDDPAAVLDRLHEHEVALAELGRHAEAADLRDLARAFAASHRRTRRLDLLRRAGRVVITIGGAHRAVFDHGLLDVVEAVGTGGPSTDPGRFAPDNVTEGELPPARPEDADELITIAAWLERRLSTDSTSVRLEACSAPLWSPLPRLPELPAG